VKEQIVFNGEAGYAGLDECLKAWGTRCLLLVCGRSAHSLRAGRYFDALTERTGIRVCRFSDYQPNPKYESVAAGVDMLRRCGCDAIAAVGGGSAMDVAKCIKLFANMDPAQNYLRQPVVPNDIPLVAVPTTAGTGSEATRFAVIYYQGEKQSVADESCLPDAVLLDASALKTLPEYQKKATMLDALCHAVESWWSVHSTEESRRLSGEAIRQILENRNGYLANEDAGNAGMLRAANVAGQAINITQTTAGHAMCYKLTTLYGIAHGHAAALCVARLWRDMARHMGDCIDPRGEAHLQGALLAMAAAFGAETIEGGAERFRALLDSLCLSVPTPKKEDWAILTASVNPTRLKNHPVRLDEQRLDALYHQILKEN